MMDTIMNLFLGMVPDVLFFVYSFICIKNIQNKKIKLLTLTTITYVICIMISQYNIYLYLIFIIVYFYILKFLYKKQIQFTEIFLILMISTYISLTSYICFKFVKPNLSNYYFIAIISKMSLGIPFLFINKLRNFYKKYCIYWNRNDKERRLMKSITIRNISLIILNIFILSINILVIYIKSIV